MPSPPAQISPSSVSRVLRSLWAFLGDANGRVQHTAAFVWHSLLRLWPAVGGQVVEPHLAAVGRAEAEETLRAEQNTAKYTDNN